MISLVLSACFALAVVLVALWAVVVANRTSVAPGHSAGRYPGRDSEAFIKGWKRKLQRIARRTSP